MEYTDFASALHPFHYLVWQGSPMPLARDGLTALAQACGMTRQTSYAWRSGRRRMSKPVQFILRLVEIHGLDALLSGELAIPPNKPAQDSSQVPKPKRPRKRKTK